jgi:hypothetical protein
VANLSFKVEGAAPVTYAAAPLLAFKLRITNALDDQPLHAVALRCQIQLDALRRHYNPHEQALLKDLYGEPERWGQTLRTMLWTFTSVIVPPFTGSTLLELPVPCSYDFNVAATKYFYALDEGEVPLTLLFSGTIFYEAEDGALQVAQVPWDQEATYRLPVRVWQDMMEHYYPNSAWLSLRKDIFDRLYRYKVQSGLPTWEQTVESLLNEKEEPGKP